MSQDHRDAELAAINSLFIAKTEGNSLPAVTLPDGSKIQTGTVGGLMMNIKLYDRVVKGESIEGRLNRNSFSCDQEFLRETLLRCSP